MLQGAAGAAKASPPPPPGHVFDPRNGILGATPGTSSGTFARRNGEVPFGAGTPRVGCRWIFFAAVSRFSGNGCPLFACPFWGRVPLLT